MASFQYDASIIENYPNLAAAVIVAQGMTNAPTPDKLCNLYLDEQAAVKARIGTTPLSELPTLSAWRRAISAFGVSPTKYRSAAESLLRRLTKKGDIPSINTLVDIGNLASIRYGLPVAIFDTRQIKATDHRALRRWQRRIHGPRQRQGRPSGAGRSDFLRCGAYGGRPTVVLAPKRDQRFNRFHDGRRHHD